MHVQRLRSAIPHQRKPSTIYTTYTFNTLIEVNPLVIGEETGTVNARSG